MKKRFRTQYDPNYKGAQGLLNELASETVPDESQSIQQMLINQAKGFVTQVSGRPGIYTEDVLVSEPVDIVEAAENREILEDEIKEITKESKRIKHEKAKEEAQRASGKATEPEKKEKGTEPSTDA